MKYAKNYFDNHPLVAVLYFTSDGLAFFEENNAIEHAGYLEDTTVMPLTRSDVAQAQDDMDEEGWDTSADEGVEDEYDEE